MSDIEEEAGPSTAVRHTTTVESNNDPLGPRPSRFGANKESMEWVVKNINTQFSAINTRLDKMDSRFDEIMDLLKKDKGKEVVVRDSSPSPPNFPSQNQSNRDPRRSPSNFQSTYSPSRTQRQGTHDIQPSNTPTRNREIRIKREDIGLFDPHHEDPDDKGIIVDGKNLIFTDIFALGNESIVFWRNLIPSKITNAKLSQCFKLFLPDQLFYGGTTSLIIQHVPRFVLKV